MVLRAVALLLALALGSASPYGLSNMQPSEIEALNTHSQDFAQGDMAQVYNTMMGGQQNGMQAFDSALTPQAPDMQVSGFSGAVSDQPVVNGLPTVSADQAVSEFLQHEVGLLCWRGVCARDVC